MLSAVFSSLNKHLIDTGLDYPIAWPNGESVEGDTWLSVAFMPADTLGATTGDTGLDETNGVYQIDIRTPVGGHWGLAHQIADRIQRQFRSGIYLTYDDHSVRMWRSSRTGGHTIDGFYTVSVSIMWRAYNRRDAPPGEFTEATNTLDQLFNTTLPNILRD